MSKRSCCIFVVGLNLLISVSLPAVAADVVVPISISVDSSSMRDLWTEARTTEIEEAVGRAIAQKFEKMFPFWKFKQDASPAVVVSVFENIPNQIEIGMLQVGQTKHIWSDVWLKPEDIVRGSRPNASNAEDRLFVKTLELLNDERRDKVNAWLLKIPIGSDGTMQTTPPVQVITSLPWTRFKELNASTLRVVILKQNQKFEIRGQALSDPQDYRESGSAYPALALQPTNLPETLPVNELPDYSIKQIYLDTYHDPTPLFRFD